MTPLKEKGREKNLAQPQVNTVIDEKSPRLLFVDSLAPIELMISFSSLSRWYEQKSAEPAEKPGKMSRKPESISTDHDLISVTESNYRKFN